MGGFGALTGLAQFGSDIGQAAGETRAFDLAKQNILSQIAERQAQALYQQGTLGVQQSEEARKQKEFEAGKFFIDQRQPYITNPDGSYSLVEYNRLGGQPRVTRMPQGFMPPDTPEAFAQQLRRALPAVTDEQVQAIVGAKYGYLRNPSLGLTPEYRQVGNQMVLGVLNKATGEWTASQDASGANVSKGTPIGWQQIQNPDGSQSIIPVPRVSGTSAKVPSGAAVAPAAAADAGSPAVAPQNVHAGIFKKPPMLSPAGATTIEQLREAQPLLNDIDQLLKESGRDKRTTLMEQIADRGSAALQWGRYQSGFDVTDPLYRQAFALADLLKNVATAPYLHGIRRGDIILRIQRHMPSATDTPALLRQKVDAMKMLMPQIEQAVYQFERERARGIPQPAQALDPAGLFPASQ